MKRHDTLFGSALLHDLLPPPVVGYVFLAATLDLVRAYRYWPNLDVPMHYVGAVVLAYVIHRGVRHAGRRGHAVPMHGWLHGLFVFALVCTTSMFWEIGEFASDRLLGTHAQLGLVDTMSDMMLDAIGAATFLLVLWFLRRRYPRSDAAAGSPRGRHAGDARTLVHDKALALGMRPPSRGAPRSLNRP
jgi:hypothetical protein